MVRRGERGERDTLTGLHTLIILYVCIYQCSNNAFLLYVSPWGEHEIDYVLFVTVPSKDSITLKPHPDEVDDVCWVSQSKLLEMFADKDLLFSPWFRLITNRWMIGGGDKGGWWDDLERTMKTDDFCDYESIHRFDPPSEHMGGGGDAGPWLESKTVEKTVGDTS